MITRGITKTFRILFLVSCVAFCLPSSAQKKKDYTPYADPFIGTGGHGHTYPGAVLPFGGVQLSPDTRLNDGPGYNFADSVIYGFSHTHLNGAGISYCDILFMPTVGDPQFDPTDYSSPFTKKNESASPGYYKTRLDKYGIDVALTATTRAGMHQYNYPSTVQANIIIDLQHGDTVINSWIEIVNDHEIRGYRQSRNRGNDRYVYFYAKFSKPFKTYGIAINNQLQTSLKKAGGKNIKLYIQFNNPGEVISKVALSSVSTDGALKNLDAVIPDFDFKKIQRAAKTAWINELSKIEVKGGGPQSEQQSTEALGNSRPVKKAPTVDYGKIKRTIFYTALYHSLLSLSIYSDVDGQYRGTDQKTHTAEGFNYYSAFAFGDTFGAQHSLLTLISRERALDIIKSYLAMYDQSGVESNENYITVIPVIVDAYAKGIKDFDAEKAFTAMKAAINTNQYGLGSYRTYGLVLTDEQGSVSKTLTYAYYDWCIAQMAKMLNKPGDYTEYLQRAQYWKNVQNKENGFMQARVNGGWYKPFNPADVNQNYAKGNAWQYTFAVPQDVTGLMARIGGKEPFTAKLNELFTTNAPNIQSYNTAYLFNFTDDTDKTQFYINKILNEEYSSKPDGFAGDDNFAQASAWYVMSSLGLYDIVPGQQQFQIGLPQFEKATVNLENGKKFVIINSGSSVSRSDIYLQGMNLNKISYNKLYIDYADIANGGEFEVYTGRLANKIFVGDLEKPTSGITSELIVPNPIITLLGTLVEIKSNDIAPNTIYYTVDGSAPTTSSAVYSKAISVKSTVKAIAVRDGKSSFVTEAHF